MGITYRMATREDAPFLAWVMQEAARSHLEKGIWDLAYPGPDNQRLNILEVFNSTDIVHFGHWSRFMVAEADGKLAAGLSAYENVEHGGKQIDKAMVEAYKKLGWTYEKMVEIPERIASFKSIDYVNYDGHWIVEWVATKPEYRGKGLIARLLQEILQEGRKQGFKVAQIGYLLGNTPAKKAYEQVGFKWTTDYKHADFENDYDCPGIASMKLDLTIK